MKRLFIALIVSTIGFTSAAQEALDYIEARKSIMKFIGGNMRTLGGMQQGQIEFNPNYIKSTGNAIASMAKVYPLLFPVGTETGGKTEVRQSAFDDPSGFRKIAAVLVAAGKELQQATSPEELQAAFGKVSGTCRSCHSQYRQ